MRIASSTLYQLGLASMNSQQGSLLHVQQQLGTGRRILTPSDDPVGATRALVVAQSSAVNDQYATSRKQANINLATEDSTLKSVTTAIQNIQTLVVQAGNSTMSDADRASVATQLEANYNQLLGLANGDDGNGNFLFAGFQSQSPPFSKDSAGAVQYSGDSGQQLLQVDVARQLATGDNGRDIFLSVQSTATYVASAKSGNTGTGTYSAITVSDPTNALYGHSISINFGTDPATGVLQYQLQDESAVPPAAIGAPVTYTDGAGIQVAGLSLSVKGTPVAGDRMDLQPAQLAGTDIFSNVKDVINALKKPLSTDADHAALANVLATTNRKMSNSLDNVSTVQTSVGARMQELDALDTIGSNRSLNYSQTLSGLQDLDYYSAITEYYQRQTSLQAAQQSFMQIQGMNLFKFL
ncbi:flagellar hook-associated protein FlgL [Cupriavidus basilensis]|uniref:flagellar hook-associated protein FlgL n=1 Tax=Cupriavidus basilensis TaxID=68895 RepID=UPI0023E7C78C|nr:flagellar hook-associated protein FlgL [Cupriavidus basilensis]MDF3882448.1 flagellar hook-associated protein FlgL [Cupriavidus basilensis]